MAVDHRGDVDSGARETTRVGELIGVYPGFGVQAPVVSPEKVAGYLQAGHAGWFAQSTIARNLQGSEQFLSRADPVAYVRAQVQSVLIGVQGQRAPPDTVPDVDAAVPSPSSLIALLGNRSFELISDAA